MRCLNCGNDMKLIGSDHAIRPSVAEWECSICGEIDNTQSVSLDREWTHDEIVIALPDIQQHEWPIVGPSIIKSLMDEIERLNQELTA